MKGKERCTLQINPDDAVTARCLRRGQGHGRPRLPARSNCRRRSPPTSAAGVVSIPYGWGHNLAGSRLAVASARPGVNSNILTDAGSIDPLSGNAVLNGIPVTVTSGSISGSRHRRQYAAPAC